VFTALSEGSNDANGLIECRGIVRQRRADAIAVLVIEPPGIEKMPGHRARSLTAFMWDSDGAVARVVSFRVNPSQPKGGSPPQGRTALCYASTLANAILSLDHDEARDLSGSRHLRTFAVAEST
jgi:hypothetical protein